MSLHVAENVIVFDDDAKSRSKIMLDLATNLVESGCRVRVYTAWEYDKYKTITDDVHQHVPITIADVKEILTMNEAKESPVVVVVDGLMAPGGNPMNRLLRDCDITVVVGTCAKKVRSDPRFTDVWHKGKHLKRKQPAKGYVDVQSPIQTKSSWWLW